MTSKGRREGGASLVEFALIVPLLSLFLFGIVQFGIAYDKQQSINSAAREGARLGALESTSLSQIATRAVESYDASASAGADPTVRVYDDSNTLRGQRDPDGTYTVNAVSTHPSPKPSPEDDETMMPCGRDTPSSFVHVVVETPYDITIPFFGVQSVTIDSEAEFRCE